MPVRECSENGLPGYKWGSNGSSRYNGAFRSIDGPVTAYWFGFVCGDGSIGEYNGAHRFSVCLKGEDKEHLDALSRFLGYSPSRVTIRKDGFASLQIASKELFDDLVSLGVFPRKAHELDGSIIPAKYAASFVRGLFDADGTVLVHNGKAMMAIYGNYPLLEGVRRVLGSKGSLIENKSRSGRADVLTLTGNVCVPEALLFMSNEPGPRLHRKWAVAEKIIEEYHQRPKGVSMVRKRKFDTYIGGRAYLQGTCSLCDKPFMYRADKVGKFCSRACAAKHARSKRWCPNAGDALSEGRQARVQMG